MAGKKAVSVYECMHVHRFWCASTPFHWWTCIHMVVISIVAAAERRRVGTIHHWGITVAPGIPGASELISISPPAINWELIHLYMCCVLLSIKYASLQLKSSFQ